MVDLKIIRLTIFIYLLIFLIFHWHLVEAVLLLVGYWIRWLEVNKLIHSKGKRIIDE